MRKLLLVLICLGAAVPLFFAGVTAWIWITIPAAPDPSALPSRTFEPPAVEYSQTAEELGQVVRALMADERLPGVSLAVAVDGEVVWAEAFGWANIGMKKPMTPATLLRIGGVSTALTSAAVGLLHERGQIDLDAPIQDYLREYPEKRWPVTTRQLMAHMAGVRHTRSDEELFRRQRCATDAERLAVFSGDPLERQPGQVTAYSTYGWVVVGAVVAAVMDEPYVDVIDREVLLPLGMHRTVPDVSERFVQDITEVAELDLAHGYFPRAMLNPAYGLQDAPESDLSCILPGAGFLSTPEDLVHLGSAMMTDGLLDASTVEMLQTPLRLASGETKGQALGWVVQDLPLGEAAIPTRVVGLGLRDPTGRSPLSASMLDGHVPGGTTTLLTVPGQRLAISVSSNVTGARSVMQIATELANGFVRQLEMGSRDGGDSP